MNAGQNLFLFLSIVFTGCVASKDPQRTAIRNLQKGKVADDSSYVYSLPYKKGDRHLLIQGYYTSFSHKNRIAIDFKMKRGAKIAAARDGVVIRTKEDGTKGGLRREYRQHGNHVVIEHVDGTRAGYWHLKKNGVLVNVGDTVKQGQVIGLSGKTGYSALPHLHFLVWTNKNGRWQQIPTRFDTKKGPRYLRPMHWYRNK
jgi:murein DD-endopeptidase MepM/ murein hydrolase activator NlpD